MSSAKTAGGKRLGIGLSELLGAADFTYDYGVPATPALVPQVAADAVADDKKLHHLPIEQVHPDSAQPRKRFDANETAELATSIRRHGLLQPLLVRPDAAGPDGVPRYVLIAGERRWRAAQSAGLKRVPCVLRYEDDAGEGVVLALIENLQRRDLNPIEEAEAYALLHELGQTHEAVAESVGKSRTHVSNLLRFLKLPPSVRQALIDERISAGHAKILAGAPDPEALLREILLHDLSVRETEKRLLRGTAVTIADSSGSTLAHDPDIAHAEADLAAALGTRVRIRHKANGSGSVTLYYRDLDRFDVLCSKFLKAT